MGVSSSSPNSHFPFGTCGVSLQGSSCETETKGASPLGTLLLSSASELPTQVCPGHGAREIPSPGSCWRASGKKMETGPGHPGPVRCLLPGAAVPPPTSDVCRGWGLWDDKDRDWFGLLHSHPTPHHGAHSPWSPLNSIHCSSHCPFPHE